MKEKVKVTLEDWDHTCGDGCCYTWGCDIKINGVEIEGTHMTYGNDFEQAIKNVLEHLGYEVEIETE